ncbi:MAG: F-type H+-transporting ATPase subunit delta [Patescibacteria group bacterium]|jgi:F0F1-type ATP synthase delta subunit|nr:F-type H+-transporting ATPase subunit delta [Patescibacteria group bacterium]
MAKLSRRKLALYAAERITSGESKNVILREVAAYLIDTGRKREASLVVRDIEAMLLHSGTAVGSVTTARPLSQASRTAIESFITKSYPEVKRVVLREFIDETLIGGLKLELPGYQFDASVKAKLQKIMA